MQGKSQAENTNCIKNTDGYDYGYGTGEWTIERGSKKEEEEARQIPRRGHVYIAPAGRLIAK